MFADEQPGAQKLDQEELKRKISDFCYIIRAKEQWFFKILDRDRALGLKWANEAGFLKDPDSTSEEDVAVRDALEELKGEARRIQIYDYTIRLDRPKAPRAVDYPRIDADILKALKYIQNSKHAIDKPELRQHIGAFISDDVVPESLHRELVGELDALAAEEPKDFHPATYGKVQDLIHPSIYPFVIDETDSTKPAFLVNDIFETSMLAADEETSFQSLFSWIPSIFEVSEDGLDVRIQSYINGLGPRVQYPVLYRLIEKVFLLVLPQLERTLAHKFQVVDSKSVKRWHARADLREEPNRVEWDALLEAQKLEKEQEEAERLKQQKEKEASVESERKNIVQFYEMDDSTAAVSSRGAKLKVIVKAANYVLKPGQEYQGTWHIEGMPHERIVASAIYYYDTDPEIKDEGLSFRYIRDLDTDFPTMEQHSNDFAVSFRDEMEGDEDEGRIEDENDAVENEGDDKVAEVEDDEGHDEENDDEDGVIEDGDDGDGSKGEEDDNEDEGDDGEDDQEDDGDGEETREEDDGLSFTDYPSDWDNDVDEHGNTTPMDLSRLVMYIPMGTVPTTNISSNARKSAGNAKAVVEGATLENQSRRGTGRIITFPNWVQHRVPSVKNGANPADASAPVARRKILCFFLVDDSNLDVNEVKYHGFSYTGLQYLSVLTTLDVPFQKRCSNPTYQFLLPLVCRKLTGKTLPAELVTCIVNSINMGLSREYAELYRRQFMEDRKAQPIDPNDVNDYTPYSLCEH